MTPLTYLKIGQVNDRTKKVESGKRKVENATAEDAEAGNLYQRRQPAVTKFA